MQAPRTIKYLAAAVLVCLLSFAMGVLTAGGGRQLKSRATSLADSARKRVAILLKGEDQFVRDELDANYRKQDGPAPGAPRTLDTSRLPLTLEVVPLANKGEFATSEELTRGALAVVGKSIFAMDKLGNVFRVENKVLRRVDLGTFPNGIESYTLDTPPSLTRTAIRTLYCLLYTSPSPRD